MSSSVDEDFVMYGHRTSMKSEMQPASGSVKVPGEIAAARTGHPAVRWNGYDLIAQPDNDGHLEQTLWHRRNDRGATPKIPNSRLAVQFLDITKPRASAHDALLSLASRELDSWLRVDDCFNALVRMEGNFDGARTLLHWGIRQVVRRCDI